jgi:F0F1-type ATP synthase membrane subunit b/b'
MEPRFLFTAASASIVDLDGTFFIQLGIFTVVALGLYFALIRPVVRLIEARRDATEGAMERSAKMKDEAASMRRDVDRHLLDIRTAASAERGRFIEEARRREREVLDRARNDSRKAVESARGEMGKSAVLVRSNLEREVDAMATAVAARVLGRSL